MAKLHSTEWHSQNNTQNNDTHMAFSITIKSDSQHNGTTKCCADCQYGNVCLCCV